MRVKTKIVSGTLLLRRSEICSETWSATLIDQVECLDSLRKKELYWINRLNTWAPNGLNVREVYEAYN